MNLKDRVVKVLKDEFSIDAIDQVVETERFEKLIEKVRCDFPELATEIEEEFIHAVSLVVTYIVTNLVKVKFTIADKQEIKNSV